MHVFKHMPSWRSFNEGLDQGPNDENQILSRDYEEHIKQFNQNKAKFDQVLSKKPEDWEKLAMPIIGNNVYLGISWRMVKLTKSLNDLKESLPTKTGDELKRAQDDLKLTTDQLKKLEEELKGRIGQDKSKLVQQ